MLGAVCASLGLRQFVQITSNVFAFCVDLIMLCADDRCFDVTEIFGWCLNIYFAERGELFDCNVGSNDYVRESVVLKVAGVNYSRLNFNCIKLIF